MANLGWGLQITVVGMGLVFALLTLLWALLSLALRLDRPPAATGIDATAGADAGGAPTIDGIDADRLAAIATAVLAHRTVRRREAAPSMRSYWPGAMLYASRWVAAGRVNQHRSWRRRR